MKGESERLLLRPLAEADLEAVLRVRLSNPQRLLRTEGSAGEPGRYDLEMLERDVWVAGMDPSRAILVVVLRADDRVVGLVDLLDEHPEDSHPWLGAVEIDRCRQRQGYGRETLDVIAAALSPGLALRARPDDDDEVARGFLAGSGFTVVTDGMWERRLSGTGRTGAR